VSQSKNDRELGMHRNIARRDFLNGVSVAVGASLVVPGSILGAYTNEAIDQGWRAVSEIVAKKS
jgi:hypothetical protein